MAMQETINKLIYWFTSTGADQVAGEMNKVAEAQTTTEKSALNLDRQFQSLERRFNEQIRAQQDYAKVVNQVNAAVAQNPALMQRGNEIIAAAGEKYGQLGRVQTAYLQTQRAATLAAEEYAGELGSLGMVLGSLHPAMLPVVAALGAAYLSFEKAKEAANEFGKEMINLRNTSQAIGLTTTQLQAFQEKAGLAGVSEEKARQGLERFSVQMDQVRQRGGPLYEMLTRIDSGLAEQIVRAHDAETEIKLLAQAYGMAGERGAALLRSAFGREGLQMAPVLQEILHGGLQVEHPIDIVSEQQINKIAKLKAEIDDMAKHAKTNLESIFSESLLERQMHFSERWLEWTRLAKDFTLSPDFNKLFELLTHPVTEAGVEAKGLVTKLIPGPDTKVIADMSGSFIIVKKSAEELKQEIAQSANEMEKLGKTTEVVGADLAQLPGNIKSMVVAGEDIARQYDKASTSIKKLTGDIEDMQRALASGGRADLLEPAIRAAQVQLKTEQDAKEAADRHNAAVLAIADAYQGVSLETAQALEKQKGQLAVAQATTAAARMNAQQQATINELLLQGKTLTEATAIAEGQRAIEQAKINAQAQQQLAASRDQYAVASSVTGAQKMAAQEAATFNQMVRQGVDEETAAAAAAQQTANAQAQVNAGVEQQIYSLQQANELIVGKARGEEAATRAAQAYNNAIRAGADATEAAALYSKTLANEQLKAAEAAARAEQNYIKEANAAWDAAQAAEAQAQAQQAQQAQQERAQQGQQISQQLTSMLQQLHDLGDRSLDYLIQYPVQELPPNIYQILQQRIKDAQERQQKADETTQKHQAGVDELRKLQEQARVQQAQSDQEKARIEAENKYQELIRSGTEPGLARQIADQQLNNALADLAKATKDNTSATNSNTDALSPYYAQDPRLSHLGFRPGSSPLDYDPFKLAKSGAASPPALPVTIAPAAPPTTTPATPEVNAGPYSSQVWPQGEVTSIVPLGYYWNRMSASIVAPSWFREGNYVDVSGQPIPLSVLQQPQPIYAGMAEGGILAPGGLALIGEHGPHPAFIRAGSEPIMISPDDPRLDYTLTGRRRGDADGERPIQIVQNFNAPVSADIMQQMKMTAFQGAQAGMRQARMGGAFK